MVRLQHEVAACRAIWNDFDVICFIRSDFSVPFFERLGLRWCIIDYEDITPAARATLAECDLIADFSLPAGTGSKIFLRRLGS